VEVVGQPADAVESVGEEAGLKSDSVPEWHGDDEEEEPTKVSPVT